MCVYVWGEGGGSFNPSPPTLYHGMDMSLLVHPRVKTVNVCEFFRKSNDNYQNGSHHYVAGHQQRNFNAKPIILTSSCREAQQAIHYK